MPRQLKLTPIVDDSLALRSFQRMQGAASGFTGSLAGIGKKGTSFSGLASAMSASGLLGQFSQLQGLLGNFSTGLDHLGGKRVNLGKVLGGVGIGAAALGGVGEQLSSPLEAAKAQLDQSIKNAGGNVAALAKPISDEQKRMQGLGFTYADTDSSLSKLTQGFGSGKKAISEEGLVADLAARNHTDLASAADLVVKAYARSPMVLKQFGINTADMTSAGKAAVSAHKNQAKAATDLEKAQQHLTQVQARLGASGAATDSKGAAKRQANAAAVISAQGQLAAAGQHLQDVEAKLREGSTKPATAQAELEAAQNRVAQAQKRLTDAEGKSVAVTGLSVSQQQELATAQGAVADAQKKKTDADYIAAVTSKDLNKANLTGQQILDTLTKKTHGLAQAQANTFGGDLRKWKATVIDFGATWGEKFAKPLVAIGPTLAGVGLLLESNFFGKIGRGLTGLTRGVLGLPKTVGGLLGTTKPVPAAAGPGPGAAAAAGSDGLSAAAAALQEAAASLKVAAAQMQGAAGAESGAAGQLDASATGLDTSGASLDAAGSGLTSSSAALDAAGTGLDGSATALDTSAAELKAAGAAGAAGGAAGGAEGAGATAAGRAAGAAGGLSLPELGLTASKLVGPAGLAVAVIALSRKPGNKAEALTEYAGLAKQIHGGTIPPTLVPQVGAREKAAWPGYRFAKTGYQDPRGKFHKWSHKGTPKDLLEPRMLYAGYAAGGVVLARPGGVPIVAGEGGQNEIIGSAPTIVAALKTALGGHGTGAPSVAHYHQTVSMPNARIYAANLDDLVKQMEAQARRANFAGHGPPGGSDL